MTAKHDSQPKTLGLLGTRLVTAMQNHLWQGAMQAAQTHGVRLIYYPTTGYDAYLTSTRSPQVLFDFVDSAQLDGLLIWYAGIIEGVTAFQGTNFFNRYQKLPLVTIGGQLSRHPDLSIDNYQGVRAAVEHLVRVHGRQHIGIIRGPVGHPDADDRYRGCVDTLHAYNLSVNPDHVVETMFVLQVATNTARSAVTRWFTGLNQKPDAVIAASDYMALAAIRAIEECGLRVPEDIAVVGFDDVSLGRANIPSLTTVRQPFYEMGFQAVEMLLALIDGQSLSSRSLISAPLIVRESCGCIAKSLEPANHTIQEDTKSGSYAVIPLDERLADELTSIRQDTGLPINQVKDLAHFLEGDFGPEASRQFMTALRQLLIENITSYFDAPAWQAAISALRNVALSRSSGSDLAQVETLFHEARVLVTEVHQRAYISQRLEAEVQLENLRRTSEALIGSFGEQLLLRTISEQLPILGFSGAYLSLYDDPTQPETWSTLILACQDRQRLDLPPEGIRFPTKQLVPPDLLPAQQITPMVVEPLYFGTQQLGILVLEVGSTQGAIYENLRALISSALQGSRLLQQVQNHAAELEQSVASRTDDLKQAVDQLQTEIAERQHAQEALAHERNLLRTLVDSMPDIIFAKDARGRFTLKNKTDARTMGASSPEETIGKTDFDYYIPAIAERFKVDDDMVIRTGEPLINREELNIDADGNEHWILMTKVPLRDAQGKVIGLVGMGRDITERKQAEEAQRKSEETAREFQEKLKLLQEVSLELVSAESFEQLCIKAIELGHSALGYDRLGLLLFEDSTGTVVSRFGIESNGELRAEHGLRYPAQNKGMILFGVLADRNTVYVNEDAVLGDFDRPVGHGWNVVTGIWDGNSAIGWLAADNYFKRKPLIPYQVELLNLYGLTIGHLVTRKRAEAEIRRLNDELEQRVIKRTAELQAAHDRLQILSRTKDDFVSNVSHELRTPITNIKLYHQLLDKRPEKFERYTAILGREISRLESLIEALLMLSRLDQNRERISFVKRDLKELLRQFVPDREALASAKNITLTLELETDSIMVEADQRLFEQVLSILLTNAFAYTPPGGRVTVRALKQVTHGECWAGFSVTDTGAGIAPDEQEHLFERFFRGMAGHDSNAPGTGLGLSIAKEIIDRHKGRIEAFSEGIGHGAVFSVWLPGK